MKIRKCQNPIHTLTSAFSFTENMMREKTKTIQILRTVTCKVEPNYHEL